MEIVILIVMARLTRLVFILRVASHTNMLSAGCFVVQDVTMQNILCEFAEVAHESSLEDAFVELLFSLFAVFKLTHHIIL